MGNVFSDGADEEGSNHDTTGVRVNSGDILKAVRSIDHESVVCQSGIVDNRVDIGSRLNSWQKPVTEWGENPPGWKDKLKSSPFIGNIDFNRKEWARARDTVDEVLKLTLKEILNCAEKYEGLKIERYYRQGSSREGLKVIAPDEFDTVLQFHIEGIQPKVVYLRQNGKNIPEFCTLKVQNITSSSIIASKYPRLHKEGVFEETSDGTVRLNARALHQAVFQSIIDQAAKRVEKQVKKAMSETNEVNFKITRSMNPPSVNITIIYDDDIKNYFMPEGELANRSKDLRKIDVDIVPALLLRKDRVPDPYYRGQTMDCSVYAVFKWMEQSSVRTTVFSNPDIIWRVCSSGYEKHTMDLARGDFRQRLIPRAFRRQRLIITALRILKTYFSKAKNDSLLPPQITTVLRSYHLKHIAFYILMYLGYIHEDEPIEGVSDVLQLFVAFLRVSLENKCIPHFFHSNSSIREIYPQFPFKPSDLRFNLLRSKTEGAMRQALLSLDNHLIPELGLKVEDIESKRVNLFGARGTPVREESHQPDKVAEIGVQFLFDVAKYSFNLFMTKAEEEARQSQLVQQDNNLVPDGESAHTCTRAIMPSDGAMGTTRKSESPGQSSFADILTQCLPEIGKYSMEHLGTKADEALDHMKSEQLRNNKGNGDDSEDERVHMVRQISTRSANRISEIVAQYERSVKSGEFFL